MPSEQHRPWVLGATVAAVVVAAALRVWAADGDLGIDEAWSVGIAARLAHPWDAFGVHHDNNHILNTMWLWWLGPLQGELAYRAQSMIAGTAMVALAALLGVGHGGLAGAITA